MTLKEALYECLEGSLSPDKEIRNSSEERLKALEVIDNFGLFLLEFVLDQNQQPPIRQLASVLLRQYINCHWSSVVENFVPPEPTPEIKDLIRRMAPEGLRDPKSKIRNSLAVVISSIAHWDWPESWGNLFDILMGLLKTNDGVKGGMRVLTELAKEFTDEHVVIMAPIILPEMFQIISKADCYSVYTRARAIQIYRTFANLTISVAEMDKSILSKYIDPVLQNYMELFATILLEMNPQISDNGLKKETIKCISLLIRKLPKRMVNFLPKLLGPVEGILVSSIESFNEILQGNSEDPDVDSDGEETGPESVIFAIFELIQFMTDSSASSQSRQIVKNGLNDLIYYTIFYMQLPQERVESWCFSISNFACDEDEDRAIYSIRVCAQDFLLNAYEEFPNETIAALEQAVYRHSKEKWTGNWRIQEACLFAISSLGTRITDQKESQHHFDIHGFLQNIVIPLLQSQDQLLVGRCLVLGSNFSKVLSEDMIRDFIHATAISTSTDKNPIIRVLACKAIANFVTHSKEHTFTKQILLEVLPNIVENLITFGINEGVEVLTTVLDTLQEILMIDERFTCSIGVKITTLCIACFVKYNGDPVICPIIEDIVKILCQNPDCVYPLQERFCPTLISVLNNRNGGIGGVQGVALDILTTIVRSSPQPLSQVLINDAFPAVIQSVNSSDDHTVLQNGGECLRAFVCFPAQVFEYRDVNGISGLNHVVQVACRLLDPLTSEFSASFVGKLVTTLIVKTGDFLGEQLDLLLRAVLSKLQSSDSLSVIQNLCMVYAHLFNVKMDAALTFLDAVPGPKGNSALHFVLTEWVYRQHMFYGQFDRKVSAMALSKLLSHGLTTQDPRLISITVRGDQIFDSNQSSAPGRVTRSKSGGQVDKWTSIPLLVKLFKLLIYELSTSIFDSTVEDDDDYSTEEEDSTEDTGETSGKRNNGLLMGNAGEDFEDVHFFDEDEKVCLEDDDILNDPMYNVNLDEYLKEYLSSFSKQLFFKDFLPHLTPAESKVLAAYGINNSL